MMLGNLVVLLVIAAAVVFLVRRFGGGCSGCGHGGHEHHHGEGSAAGGCCSHEHSAAGAEGEKDPVCGMRVGADAVVLEHQGRKYRFCSEHCRDSFDNDPGKYV